MMIVPFGKLKPLNASSFKETLSVIQAAGYKRIASDITALIYSFLDFQEYLCFR